MRKRSACSYVVEQATTEGIAMLSHPRYCRQVWVRCQLRKPHRCAVTGRMMPAGAPAYRPITNQRNRMERICEQVIKEGVSCQ
jgi:hypothetical protein